jgi:hypothetical protein
MSPRDLAATSLVTVALTIGCVPAPSREGVGGYCHRDAHCLEGLRCLELECREALRAEPGEDAAAIESDASRAMDAGAAIDGG